MKKMKMNNKRRFLMASVALSISGSGCGIKMEASPQPFQVVSRGTSAESEEARIDIYQTIGESFWEEGITAISFTKELSEIDDSIDLSLHISTNGGDTMEGSVMYNALMARKGLTNVYIDGYAISMGSVLAMAGINSGGKTYIAKNGMMMIHKPITLVYGNADEMQERIDLLNKVEKSLSTAYIDATGKDAEEIAEMLSATTWMDAEECVEKGFASEVIESKAQVEACLPHEILEREDYGKIPKSFVNQFVAQVKKSKAAAVPPKTKPKAVDAPQGLSAEDAVKAERKRCSDIHVMCAKMGHSAQATYLIEKEFSIEEANDYIAHFKASVDQEISSRNVSPQGDPNEPGSQGERAKNWDNAYGKAVGKPKVNET